MNDDVLDIMLDDPAMDMVDAEIDELEDTEFELQSDIEEACMVLVECECDKMESVPGFMLGIDENESEDDPDPYEGITLI